MPQNTNLNVSPYFDDFNEDKNYKRVLFKPGTPIQARELTTLQSILQNQIEKFGNHFFKDGSMVIPGQIAYDLEYTCVQINETHLGIPVSAYIKNFEGKLIKGQTSGVIAKVETYISNTESERSTYTLYAKYISSSDTNFTTSTFIDGENLVSLESIDYEVSAIRANSTFATTISSGAVSTGSAAKIGEGVYFIRGFFVKVQPQTVILDQYTNAPSYRIGLIINEELAVASNDYDDLYDNAQGFSNFAAPGADRLVITTELIKKDINDFNDENFIELLRLRNGEIEKFVTRTEYSLIKDELARRTYDESGDYYIKPFDISVKECLNDKIGNNGVFSDGEQTRQGNVASESLGCISISPGKAYIRGYEVETDKVLLDFEKPRTTDRIVDENIQFSFGNQILVNNVYGSIPIEFSSSAKVSFYDTRTNIPGISTGTLIGVSKVYDYEVKSSEYTGPQTEYVVSLYDTQLFTKIETNVAFTTLQTPALIVGKSSGARGFLYQSVSNSRDLYLYDVAGTFNLNEPITIDGIDNNRSITAIRDYKIGDVNQIVANENNVGIGTFTADPILTNKIYISDIGASFTIGAPSIGGVSVVVASNIFFNNIFLGDIVSYTKPGDNIPTYSRINSINQNNGTFSIVPTTSVAGVSSGPLPASEITVNDLRKVEPTVLNPTTNFYLPLKYKNVSNVNLDSTAVTVKKTFSITVSSSSVSYTLTDPFLSFEGFDEENFNLSFKNNGAVVKLQEFTNINFSTDRKEVTITGLTQTGPALLIAACKLSKVSTRKKFYDRCSSLIINKSVSPLSGNDSTTLDDGLTYDKSYGLRVQDKEISLNVPDVVKVLAIYESSNKEDPKIPTIVLGSLTSNILNAIKGEKVIGSTSNCVGYFVNYLSNNEIEYVSVNENKFVPGEQVVFQESGLTATIESVFLGDKNITNLYDLDSGYREQYLDFSRIIRKNNLNSPNRKIRIIYNKYVITNNNSGDLVTVNSYDADRYKNDLPKTKNIYASDFLDFRPSVAEYSGSYSPFESKSRIFTVNSNSTPHIVARNSTINVSYDYYLPRIDKLFLYKDGIFFISSGVPSINPSTPQNLDNALEIATLNIPSYLRNVSEIKIDFTQHKRYTMKDISRLEDRIKNVEYYTLLSLLEQDTKNLIIRDETTGLDRFKSGFFVDNFRQIEGGDITNPDYKASLDTNNGILRPTHYTTSLDLALRSKNSSTTTIGTQGSVDTRYNVDLGSNNVRMTGDIISLDYTDEEYISNPFATRIENVNPFNVLNWVGSIEFNPSSDVWIETRRLADRTVGTIEGDFLEAIRNLNVDTNTGLSPIEWGAWETVWTGTTTIRNTITNNRDRWGRTRGRRGRNTNNTNTTTTTITTDQERTGTQFQVTERLDTISLGDRVVSTSVIKVMRSRNIEIIARRLKPKTRFYAFFDDVNVTDYIIPKLIEINMVSGTFIAGETVTGVLGSKQIRFNLAPQNHKYGPVGDIPGGFTIQGGVVVENYKNNIYNPSDSLPDIYSATSKVLNVDTASLEANGISEFFGYIGKDMRLVGMESQAVATVSDLRLISDDYGTFIGSLFIPDPTVPSTPSFETGTKTLVLTTSPTNSQIVGFSDSSATGNFTSSGVLQNVEASNLMIRNADIETVTTTDTRRLQQTTVTTTTTPRPRPRPRTPPTPQIDPLAQSFLVSDENGICLTKCDIFFRSKDSNNIPVTLQIRTVELGTPTLTILPFGEVTINPDNVNLSDDGKVSTTFYFQSPVYLENGKEYAIVLVSLSSEYTVWISRMGEPDVSTLDLPESDRVIVSQQPLLGSLFKSQNGSTWDASQYEDLKFTLYRANFVTTEGSVRFYNPNLNIGNNQITSLVTNPIFAYSKSVIAGISKSFTSSDINLLVPGATITQENNSYFKANLISVVGSVGIGSTLIVTDAGTGFGNTTTIFTNVNLVSFTGLGQGAKANIGVVAGVAKTVTVTQGGTGYLYGDVLTVDPNDTNNLGRDLIISVPNSIGVITSFNSILLNDIQGDLVINTTSSIISNGTTITSAPVPNNPTVLTDGLHFKVTHNNHGMYSSNNFVTICGIEPDVPPLKLTSDTNSTTTQITLSSVGILTTFENIPVNTDNPGYILINNEIIKYTEVDVPTNTLTGITRFNDTFLRSEDQLLRMTCYIQNHNVGDDVFKYEFNGVSLKRINTTHNLNEVDTEKYPITLDSYHIKVDMRYSGDKNRSSATGTSPLYFNISKSGGSYTTTQVQANTVRGPKATQNILMTSIRPNIQTLVPETTSVNASVRTVSATSISGNEPSFIDKGFEAISLNSNNYFSDPRMICSRINESEYLDFLPDSKSFTMEIVLKTGDTKVSPMIDLDRVNIIATMNRIDRPVLDYINDSRVNELYEDPHAAVYVSRLVNLEKPADSLKVMFDAYRHSTNDIRVAYRLIRENIPEEQQVYELFPGYNNLDNNRNTINTSKNDGLPDILVPSSNNMDDYRNYEFSAKNLPQFSGYQIKVMMSGTSQANVPLLKDFRAIATI